MGKTVVLCGVPEGACTAGKKKVSQGIGKFIKAHSDHTEAFNCHVKWLLSQGYERIGSREFKPSDGGYVRVLTKKSRFGARLRNGKESGRSMPPKRRGGVAIST